MEDRETHDNFIEVKVITTAGSYPENGTERVSVHQKVKEVLKKAAEYLGITNTSGWVATTIVSGQNKTLNIEGSYIENGLSDSVDIDYGPQAGGGGRCTV